MPSVFRVGTDYSVGHCYSPRQCLNGSPDVFADGKTIVRKTDDYGQTHSCGDNTHSMSKAFTGSSTVLINGLGVHRTGDLVSCGDTAGAGSPTVFAN